MDIIIGRETEKSMLSEMLKSHTAELLIVYGRRRVGKTYLIRSFLRDHMAFELTGMYRAPMKDQLQQFALSMQEAEQTALPSRPPLNWIEAFDALRKYLLTIKTNKKQVVFLDEFPWLDSRRSGFLSAFEHFWNTWGGRQKNLLVVICGSSASWMLHNIINNKGGLHNRITRKMPLEPFSLSETESYLQSNGCKLDRYHILQIYMAFGGIPHYLQTVGRSRSAAQAIERTCFSAQGLLTGEFDNLYNSLFELADNHIKVVRALGAHAKGLTRQEIIKICGLSSGGRASIVLDELEKSGFIKQTIPYGRVSKDSIYRLIDEFTIFYLKFMDKKKPGGKDTWTKLSATQSYAIWCGIAFEAVCLKHTQQIKDGFKIQAASEESAWRYVPPARSKEKGAQIDLLIDRDDRIINICEIKFYNKEFSIDKPYAKILEQKQDVFLQKAKPGKTVFISFITTFGLKENEYSDKLVQQEITTDALFKK